MIRICDGLVPPSIPLDRTGRSLCAAATAGSRTSCVFFFQAEDGIRDLTVTGVQTCALPISLIESPPGCNTRKRTGSPVMAQKVGVAGAPPVVPAREFESTCQSGGGGGSCVRSEERRVGEEGRSRWSPYH